MFDDCLRSLVSKEWKAGRFRIGFLDLLLLAGMTLMGILIRISLIDVESMDYTVCLKPWVDEFKAAGTFRAICGDFYNYTPLYMYVLYFISLLPIEPLYPIKIVSSLFDFILAIVSAKIVFHLTENRTKSFLTYGILFCLPTIAVNSGLWGQCDVIYVTAIIVSLYFLYQEHPHVSMIFYGLAFALKLQALFVFPLYVFLWVKKKYKIGHFLYLPFMYILTCIPSALAGKSIRELLMVYVDQGNTEPWMLSWNWPNIYLLYGPNNFYEQYSTVGVIGTIAVLMLFLYFMVRKCKEADDKMILRGLLLFALVVPFFLPYMHERYGYLADVLTVILAFVYPEKFYIPMAEVLLSYTAYTGYLHGYSTVPQPFYCFAMAALVAIVSIQLFIPDLEKRIVSKYFRNSSTTAVSRDNQA